MNIESSDLILTLGVEKMSSRNGTRKKAERNEGARDQARLPLSSRPQAQEAAQSSKTLFQLRTELHRLQQRDREWKMMFQMLSHDLKEPLLTLEGFSQLLEGSEGLNRDQKRFVKVVREAVGSLHQLIESMQSISKLYQESDQQTHVSILEILHSVESTLAEQLKRTRGQIQLPNEDLVVRGDPIRLYQVFLNLIANSLKYHKKNVDPVINIRFVRGRDNHRISISDNGVGIHRKDLERIFVPFTRLEGVDTEGVGLGLSIVKRIAESMGGQITVKSQQNQGTRFTLVIPREKE
ncbi:MAG: sensor histidine kinase [Bradymonadales bacterium]|nr:MAG: sensor histidine kinase [Bradymonadales bacterium]